MLRFYIAQLAHRSNFCHCAMEWLLRSAVVGQGFGREADVVGV